MKSSSSAGDGSSGNKGQNDSLRSSLRSISKEELEPSKLSSSFSSKNEIVVEDVLEDDDDDMIF